MGGLERLEVERLDSSRWIGGGAAGPQSVSTGPNTRRTCADKADARAQVESGHSPGHPPGGKANDPPFARRATNAPHMYPLPSSSPSLHCEESGAPTDSSVRFAVANGSALSVAGHAAGEGTSVIETQPSPLCAPE